MIKKIIETDLTESAKNLKATAQQLNDKAVNNTETLIDEAIAIGEQWQDLMEKALHGGVKILGKQQDLTLTALETAKAQYLAGNGRLIKLLGLEGVDMKDWTRSFFSKAKKTSPKSLIK